MIRNNIKISLRNLTKHRSHSIINISGLTIGIAIFFMIMMFVKHELSYDKKLSNYDRIYKLTEGNGSTHSGLLAPLLQENIPEIENTFRFYMFSHSDPLISYKDKNIHVSNCAHVDTSLLLFFHFQLFQEIGKRL